MIAHPIYRVLAYEVLGPYTLRVQFDDQSWQTIDFEPILREPCMGHFRILNYSTKFASIQKFRPSSGRMARISTQQRCMTGRST